mgnify:CR=1 FL=1
MTSTRTGMASCGILSPPAARTSLIAPEMAAFSQAQDASFCASKASEGLIAREPGRGTRALMAAASNAPEYTDGGQRAQLTGLLENLVSMGLKTSVKVLEVKGISASESIAEALQVPLG